MDQIANKRHENVKVETTGDLLDPQTATIGIALIVVLVTIALYFLSKKSSRKSILLVGFSDVGKTALLVQLAYGTFVSTVTSIKEREELVWFKSGKKQLSLVDVPGFDRLRTQFWDKFKTRALGVVYVIDSVNFMSNVHNFADLLYQYLSDDFIVSQRIPFLVACNKQDDERAKSAKFIASQLEKEFNTIRKTRIGALGDTDAEENDKKVLGNPNKPFTFSDIKNNVCFVDCSASPDKTDLDRISKWIESIA